MAVLRLPAQGLGTVDALKNFDHGGQIPERPEAPGGARGPPNLSAARHWASGAPKPHSGPLVATSPPPPAAGPQASGMELEITRRMHAPARRCV
jgi:hypothetical protein